LSLSCRIVATVLQADGVALELTPPVSERSTPIHMDDDETASGTLALLSGIEHAVAAEQVSQFFLSGLIDIWSLVSIIP
jgi:hypothetical protein